MRDDLDLPVLHAVVRGGDPAVIRSARRGFVLVDLERTPPGIDVNRGIGARRASWPPGAAREELPAEIDDHDDDELEDTLVLDEESRPPAPVPHARPDGGADIPDAVVDPERLERLVEAIVERHLEALRRDVRDALERVLATGAT